MGVWGGQLKDRLDVHYISNSIWNSDVNQFFFILRFWHSQGCRLSQTKVVQLEKAGLYVQGKIHMEARSCVYHVHAICIQKGNCSQSCNATVEYPARLASILS